ncbi:MAG TPA: HEAT repeat domain-containing protein [Kofleriaceae bacterium]|jgi:HEAT repeat protein
MAKSDDVPAPAPSKRVSLEDRQLEYAELEAAKDQLSADDLLKRLGDGRAIVRANAMLGLAVLGHKGPDLIPFLRDANPRVAQAAADGLFHLGIAQQAHLRAIAAALDGARPAVTDRVMRMFAELVGRADEELVSVLDTADVVPANSIVEACKRVGVRGLHLLQAAAADDRVRVRINAVRGIAQLGDLEHNTSMEVLVGLERADRVSDVRAATRSAIGALAARTQQMVVQRRKTAEPTPPTVPELELRLMTPAELQAAAGIAPLDELLGALTDARIHARTNAVRILALRGAAAASTARPLAVLLRDPEDTVRVEVATALGKLGHGAVVVAPALVRALGDKEAAVAQAAQSALAELGDSAAMALLDGLDTKSDAQGSRAATLIGKLADGPRLLREALASASIDARVYATDTLGTLGRDRAGSAIPTLTAAAAAPSSNARLRAAIAKALAILEPKPEKAPPKLAIDGFAERVLNDKELGAAAKEYAGAGIGGVAAHLHDANLVVRANAVAGLGTLGGGAVDTIAVCLRDDAPEVRLAAAKALDRIGDAAVIARAAELVRALRDPDAAYVAQVSAMLKARAQPDVDDALGRGLDTIDSRHAARILDLIVARPTAVDILCDAFVRPTTQVHATRGLVQLGKERIGHGRALLENSRVGGSVQTRELARNALRELDGGPVEPEAPPVDGFETKLLETSAFASSKMQPAQLLGYLQDGRPTVRANAVTALGAIGAAALPYATTVGAMLRDDEDRVRIAAASALDKLGDDAVVAAAPSLVGALKGSPRVADACKAVLAARKGKVENALIAGLETADESQGLRVAELITSLPNAREVLFIAFDGPAQNVQINAALGIGMLGSKKAGPQGRARLVNGLTGPYTRRRDAMVRALALLGPE